MNCWDQVRKVLRDGAATSVELAELCRVGVRAMNSRLQFYKYRGLIRHNGLVAPKRTRGRGRRAKFWELA